MTLYCLFSTVESGRIRVYVRVRPRNFEETKRQEGLGVDVDSTKSEVH